MLEDEQNLVKKAQDGEVKAFGSLYDYYLPKIYRFVLLKVSHREEAEDLTHQAFLKAWENIEQYDFRGYSFGSWLYRIARNVTVDYYRGARLEVRVEDVSEVHLVKDNSLEEDVERSLEWQRLAESIKKLKEVEQDVIVMRFVEDLSLKDIAEAIGKSEGAVKVIQHRAIKNLKKIIEHKEKNG
ncbi:MAG: sigma-70 family RNA polymerase sigma factor [Patescibacteria group bacterium]